MKLRLFISCVLLMSVANAQFNIGNPFYVAGVLKPAAAGGNPPSSPLVNQNFEGAGYDNSESWTESGFGTKDEDYTGTVLLGSQSFRIVHADDNGGDTSFTLASALGEVWGFFMWRPVDDRNQSQFAYFQDSGFATVFYVRTEGDKLRVSTGGTAADTVSAYSVGTTYYIWWHYLKGTGANAVGEVWFSSTSTKPGDGSNGHAITSDGTSATDAKYFYVSCTGGFGGTADFLFDHVYLDDEAILSNP